ncbi:hypothetical protein BDU57DRAFT_518172 [Ampelomyces quisqualis]|uniref:Uncharacterized protein n=1 Tax=Ampelomyces quisqualis TaxID=50730 RepID=A0A6A5QIP7_AMPQU|nr:hypothetical protein BDU57DRAFT_518172 [Ampelomyces quisqualis]
MKPASLPARLRPRPVCQWCGHTSQQPLSRRVFVSASPFKAPSTRRQPVRSRVAAPRPLIRSINTTAQALDDLDQPENGNEHAADGDSASVSHRILALKALLADVEAQIKAIYNSPKVEPEGAILRVLDELADVTRQAIAIRSQEPHRAKTTIWQSSAGAILSGLGGEANPKPTTSTSQAPLGLSALPPPAYLSKLAQDFIKHEKVFLSANVLGLYIHLQRLLSRPRTIPEALYLYANKPIPEEGSSPPKLIQPSPKSAKQVIPADLADDALTAAIEAKDLTLALTVVDHTYCAPAWRRHRMITKLGLPSVLLALTPLAIYRLAEEASVYSNLIDPWTFKVSAFLGIGTYVACTCTLGFVALTTHNDHHDRVVWRPGVPLLDRYMREAERAALDRIACAWGFKEEWRRGDEDSEDWEGLRQWILLRGMVLDKSDLMPGMNPGR